LSANQIFIMSFKSNRMKNGISLTQKQEYNLIEALITDWFKTKK